MEHVLAIEPQIANQRDSRTERQQLVARAFDFRGASWSTRIHFARRNVNQTDLVANSFRLEVAWYQINRDDEI